MRNGSDSATSLTLLGRIRQGLTDQAAWREFVRRYGPKIYLWCRQWGLQDADAEDVTQRVMLKLMRRLQSFHYDPSGCFRAWLRTVTQHAVSDLRAERLAHGPADGQRGGMERLNSVEARADLLQRLADEYDLELLEEAMARVRLRVEPRTWEAFRFMVLDDLPGPEIARRLGMQVAFVYVYARRVAAGIRREVERMESGTADATAGP